MKITIPVLVTFFLGVMANKSSSSDDSLPRNVITFVVFNMAAVQKESDQRLDEFSYYNSLPRVFGEDLKLRAPLFLIIAETSDDLNDVARNLKDEGFFVNILFQSDEVYVMEASLDMNQTPGSDFLAIRKKREITCYKCVIKNQSGKKNKKPSGNGGYGRGGYGYQAPTVAVIPVAVIPISSGGNYNHHGGYNKHPYYPQQNYQPAPNYNYRPSGGSYSVATATATATAQSYGKK